jgi:DNA-binding HxlR family transcriptional regulator
MTLTHKKKGGEKMAGEAEESLKEFLKIIGAKGTKEILEFLDENKEGRYMHFRQFSSTHMLNIRLRQLLKFDLIKHHIIKMEKKREWYTITKKGKKILHYLRKMEEVIQEYSHERDSSTKISGRNNRLKENRKAYKLKIVEGSEV